MKFSVESRLPSTGTSIFSVMSKMAQEENAINLSQGFPDFGIDDDLIALVSRYMREGYNQYAPMPGVVRLREAISQLTGISYGYAANADTEVTITAGATEGIFAAIAAFVRHGDEVILFDPAYDSYDPAITLNGGVPVHINLVAPDFPIDWDAVNAAISPRTRAIIVNSPHNPTGRVLSKDDISNLKTIALTHRLVVISDEVYDRVIFDGRRHLSVLSDADLRAQSVAVFSFGKTFHATGWKCGYTVAPALLTAEIRKTHQFIVFSVNTPVQMAIADYLDQPFRYEGLPDFFQRKRDLFLSGVKGSSLQPLPCEGSYFQIMSYAGISGKSDIEMAKHLTRSMKVASIPLSVFYRDGTDNRLLRFCFAKKDETLEKACEILRKI